MSEAAPAAPHAETAAGPLATLGGLYFSPGDTFRGLVARPRWVVPFLALMALNLAFLAVWMRKVEPREFMRNQMEESGQMAQIPPEKLGDILDQQVRMFPVMGWVGGLLGAPLMYLLLAAVFLFVFRFVFGGEVSFTQALTVVMWSFLPVALLSVPLMLTVLHLKGDWNIDPNTALQASPAAVLTRNEVPKPLYALAASIDLFTLWIVGLMSAGFAAALRRPFSSGLAGVGGAWVVYVLGKVALAALLAMM
jgi:hypothetical protein